MGCDLKIAEYKDDYLTEKDLWRYTQQFLLHAKHTATYKFILMKALLESLPELDESGKIDFLNVTYHVAKIYWNLVIKFGLYQMNAKGKHSKLELTLLELQQKYHIPQDWNFDKLSADVQQEIIQKVNAAFKRYVYGSFYSSFNGTIYSFNRKEGWLQLNPPYIVFFERYKTILLNVTNYRLAVFLEKYNEPERVVNILNKVELVSMRQSLAEFAQLLQAYGEECCFYCKKTRSKLHVDHFVPWSYVQNDILWNFVLACPSCNSSKSNKLADSLFLEKLVERNNEWRAFEKMESYREVKLVTMYEYAQQNGFLGEWVPR